MSRFRVFINPFDTNGNYTEFVEVTEDVSWDKLSSARSKLDNNEYDVGVFNFSDLNLILRNESGRYSDVSDPRSIFSFKRTDSLFKIEWHKQDYNSECGISVAGCELLSEPEVVFFGLLNDEASSLGIKDSNVNFKVLGIESIFNRVLFPLSDVDLTDDINNLIFKALDQTIITDIMTVDISNINVGLNFTLDNLDEFENITVKEALDNLLLMSNSVLYIGDNKSTVFVRDRNPSGDSIFEFYGQASANGIEDVQDLSNIRNGLNKTFNYWTWTDTSLFSEDISSVNTNGVRKKEISFESITDTNKIQTILNTQKNEFRNPKKEYDLTTTMTYDKIKLNILDIVNVDYPTLLFATPDADLPIYGFSKYGEAVYPVGEFSVTIERTDKWKIVGIKYNMKNQLITFSLRGL